MIQVEEFKHDISRELHARERYWMEQLKATLNKVIPTRTKNEYLQDNKEEILERHKQYYQNNKEQMLEHYKQYYQNNKEVLAAKDKQYQQHNKEKLSEYRKQYQQKNKERIEEKQKQKYTCECGSTLCIAAKCAHNKSAKHLAWVATLPTVSDSSVCV
jgi:hypothetical protein